MSRTSEMLRIEQDEEGRVPVCRVCNRDWRAHTDLEQADCRVAWIEGDECDERRSETINKRALDSLAEMHEAMKLAIQAIYLCGGSDWFVERCNKAGIKSGFGVRAQAVLKEAGR